MSFPPQLHCVIAPVVATSLRKPSGLRRPSSQYDGYSIITAWLVAKAICRLIASCKHVSGRNRRPSLIVEDILERWISLTVRHRLQQPRPHPCGTANKPSKLSATPHCSSPLPEGDKFRKATRLGFITYFAHLAHFTCCGYLTVLFTQINATIANLQEAKWPLS